MEEYEYEEEEERTVVMIELQGTFDPEVLFKDNPPMKIVGIDTGEPVLQIGNCIFSGTFEDTLGTMVFFDKPNAEEPGESPCVCKTDKKLTMKRVFLEPKIEVSEPVMEIDKETVQQMIDTEGVIQASLDMDLNLADQMTLSIVQPSVASSESITSVKPVNEKNITRSILTTEQSSTPDSVMITDTSECLKDIDDASDSLNKSEDAPLKGTEDTPRLLKDMKDTSGLLKDTEGAPRHLKDTEDVAGPLKDINVESEPLKNPEAAPEPVKDTDLESGPVKNTDLAPGPVKNTDPVPGPVPVKDTEAALVKDTEAAPGKDTEAAPVKDTEAAPVKDTEAAPVKDTEAAPVKDTETALSTEPVKNTEDALIKDSEAALSTEPVKNAEDAPGSFKDTEDAPGSFKDTEDAPGSFKDTDNIPGPVEDTKVESEPLKYTEDAFEPLKNSENVTGLSKGTEAVPRPLKDIEDVPGVLKNTESVTGNQKRSSEDRSSLSLILAEISSFPMEANGSDLSEVETDRSNEFDDLVIISECEDSNEATGACHSSPTNTVHIVPSGEDWRNKKLSEEQMDSNAETSYFSAGPSPGHTASDSIPGVIKFLMSKIQGDQQSHSIEGGEQVNSPGFLNRPLQESGVPSGNMSSEEAMNLELPHISTSQAVISGSIPTENPVPLQILNDRLVCESQNFNIAPEVSSQEQFLQGLDLSFSTSSISEREICEMGSAVNSTVSDSGEVASGPAVSLISLNNQGKEATSSKTHKYSEDKTVLRPVKNSVDSTSNKVFQPNEKRNHKSNSGIDSTTNESGDKLSTAPVGSPLSHSIASSSNSRVDSTLNNLTVDFEMREVGPSASGIEVKVNISPENVNFSIDSTSNNVSQVATTHQNSDQEDVTESVTATYPRIIELIQNDQPCEVSESCSERSRSSQVSNSELQRNDAVPLETEQNYPDESSLFCNVTESHIDESLRSQSASIQDGNFFMRSPPDHYDDNISESHLYESHELSSYSSIQFGAAPSILNSTSNTVSESCSSSENNTALDHAHGHSTGRQTSPRQSQGQDIDSSSNNRVAVSLLNEDIEMSAHISDSSMFSDQDRELLQASSSMSVSQRSELISGSQQHVTASSDCSLTANQPDCPNQNEEPLSIVLESNREAAVCDISGNIEIDKSYNPEGNYDLETPALEAVSVRGDDEVSESSIFYSRTRPHVVSEELCSEADALDAVSHSLDLCRPVILNPNCGQSSFCEVSESDENIIYIVASPEANENEVTASGTSDIAERCHAPDVIDLVTDDEAMDIILVSSEQDETTGGWPCVSSNERSRSTSESCNIVFENVEAQEILGPHGPDSRPSSSSKERLNSNAENPQHVYDIESSPEAENFNDPCSSSSNKFLTKEDGTSEHEGDAGQYYDVENLGCCATSDDQQLVKSYRGVQELAKRFLHNEAEVTESCTRRESRLAWDASESNSDEEGTLYIVTDSPDAEVSESCATVSDQHVSRQGSARTDTSADLSSHSASINESNTRQLTFEATGSNITFKTADLGSSSDSDDQNIKLSHGCFVKNAVSNSSEVFHSSQDVVNVPEDPEDSSSCEVTESCVDNNNGSSGLTPNQRFPGFPRHVSPSSSDVASTSQEIVSFGLQGTISSTASNRPSTSGLSISSANDESCSSVIVSSANEVSRLFSDSRGDSLISIASDSSDSASQSIATDLTLETAEQQAVNSVAENPADSTNDSNRGSRNPFEEQPPDGSYNLKFPSSTSQ